MIIYIIIKIIIARCEVFQKIMNLIYFKPVKF